MPATFLSWLLLPRYEEIVKDLSSEPEDVVVIRSFVFDNIAGNESEVEKRKKKRKNLMVPMSNVYTSASEETYEV